MVRQNHTSHSGKAPRCCGTVDNVQSTPRNRNTAWTCYVLQPAAVHTDCSVELACSCPEVAAVGVAAVGVAAEVGAAVGVEAVEGVVHTE